LFQNREIVLTETGQEFIRLSTVAWLTDLRFKEQFREVSPEETFSLARRVVNLASRERTLRSQQRAIGHVDYFTLLTSVAKAGSRILREFVEKGF